MSIDNFEIKVSILLKLFRHNPGTYVVFSQLFILYNQLNIIHSAVHLKITIVIPEQMPPYMRGMVIVLDGSIFNSIYFK
jgi:hypothetical protein